MKTLIGGFFIITLMSCSERKQFFLVHVNNGGMRVYKWDLRAWNLIFEKEFKRKQKLINILQGIQNQNKLFWQVSGLEL